MKKQVLFLLFCFCCQFMLGQSKKDIRKYKVKAVTNTVTKLIEGKEITYKNSYERFDKDGNILEEIKFNEDGKPKRKETFTYNKDNEVTEHVIYNPDGTVKKKEIKKYNAFNKKVEEIVLDSKDKQLLKEVNTYNSHGDKIQKVIYNANGSVQKTIYTYDKNGFRTEKSTYDGNGKLLYAKKYSYDY